MKSELVAEGTIEKAMGQDFFRVTLGNGHSLLAKPSGKIHVNHVRLHPGDKVRLALSEYDLSRGVITYRLK